MALHEVSWGDRHLEPDQPRDSMPSLALDDLQSSSSLISEAGAPFSRQELPPQPAHCRLSLLWASLQMPGRLMALHEVSWGVRHVEPDQPRDSMPSTALDDLQSSSSLISEAGAPFSRQELPPQPAHSIERSLECLQMFGSVMELHCAFSSVRQLLPPQPRDSTPRRFLEWAQIRLLVMSAAVAFGLRQLLPPQPMQSRPSLSLALLHMPGTVMLLHIALLSSR